MIKIDDYHKKVTMIFKVVILKSGGKKNKKCLDLLKTTTDILKKFDIDLQKSPRYLKKVTLDIKKLGIVLKVRS